MNHYFVGLFGVLMQTHLRKKCGNFQVDPVSESNFSNFFRCVFLILMSVQCHFNVKREKKAMATGQRQSFWSEKAKGDHTKKEFNLDISCMQLCVIGLICTVGKGTSTNSL